MKTLKEWCDEILNCPADRLEKIVDAIRVDAWNAALEEACAVLEQEDPQDALAWVHRRYSKIRKLKVIR